MRGLLKIHDHLEGILAHWESHVTNAYMEALNSVAQPNESQRLSHHRKPNHHAILRRWQTKHPLRTANITSTATVTAPKWL